MWHKRAVLAVLTAIAAAVVLAAPARAQTWAWCSSASQGTWQSGGYYVNNDMWNGGAGPQTICANSPSDVQVTSDQPAGNTAIETYPDVQGLYTGQNVPVSDFTLIRNTYAESFPADVTGEAADDVWLNNWGLEMMIWVDTHNEDPSYDQNVGTADIFGTQFTVYRNGSEFIFYPATSTPAGHTHILASIRWLIANGFAPADTTLTAVDFGWEIAATNGPEQFNLASYALHDSCHAGITCPVV